MKLAECTNPEIGRLIGHYELDQLDTEDRERFEEHLLKCAFCAGEVEQMYPLALALQANREGVRRRLAADGITTRNLADGDSPEPTLPGGGPRRRRSRPQWGGLFRRPAMAWRISGAVAGAAVLFLVARLVLVPPMSAPDPEYLPLLSFHPLPFTGSVTLRGEEAVPGKTEFDAGMQAYLQADFKRASRLLKRAVEKNPEQAEWWMYLGICSYLQQDPKPAVRALSRADELARGNERIRVRWFLAQAHLLQGSRESAEPLLEWIVTQNKDFYKEAFDTLSRLRKLGLSGGDRTMDPFVVSPQGGDIFLAGSTINVAWTDPQRENVREYQLWLSSDGGVTFPELITAGLAPTTSSWQWNTAARVGPRLAIRLAAVRDGGSLRNTASRVFAVSVPPRVAISSPRRGDRWRRGITHQVAWTNAGIWPLKYTVGLYRTGPEDTTLVQWIASAVPGTVTSCSWTDTVRGSTSGPTGDNFRVKVTALFTHGQVEAWSDGDFFLAPLAVVRVDSFPESDRPRLEGDAESVRWQVSDPKVLGYSLERCTAIEMGGELLARNIAPRSNLWLWRNVPSGSYYVRVIAHYPEGDVSGYSPVPLTIQSAGDGSHRGMASIDEAGTGAKVPHSLRLEQNYPNPFNAATTINFELQESGPVRLVVFSSLGQLVATLVDQSLPPGRHTVQFDGRLLPSGVYLYSLEMGGQADRRKMMLTK